MKIKVDREEGDFGLDMGKMVVPAQEIHCAGCGRFLGFQAILIGALKLKCPNCKEWNTLDISPGDKAKGG